MRVRRVATRLTGVVLATLVGGGLGAAALSPATAGAAARKPATAGAAVGKPATAGAALTKPAAATVVKAAAAGCATGKYQKQVEWWLHKLGGFGRTTVDGKQSAADCAAIKKFQKRYGIQPAQGLAGPTTNDVAKRLAATSTKACKAKKSGVTFCVDLTHQTTWVMKNGKVYLKPTITRTGMKGYRTPAGTYTINKRTTKEWSDPYKVWLPYWQHFTNGIGFHQTTTYLHNASIGSHGCAASTPSVAPTVSGRTPRVSSSDHRPASARSVSAVT